jgi:starch phosphorylase
MAIQSNSKISRAQPSAEVRRLSDAIADKLFYAVGKTPEDAKLADWFTATALATRDRIVDVWLANNATVRKKPTKRVYYLSIEFLVGRLLYEAVSNLGIADTTREALAQHGVDFDEMRDAEPEPALGNGGLGRLAACFIESLATSGVPAFGYGIRYDQGLFQQHVINGHQYEFPDSWLIHGSPWLFPQPDATYPIRFGGNVEYFGGSRDTARAIWHAPEIINAQPWDMPICGWRGKHVNSLRLWAARSPEPFKLSQFNSGDYVGATASEASAEAISRVLYPSPDSAAGQELRLRQEYFFTSASLQDILARHVAEHGDIQSLPQFAAIQMNDTHPAIAVPELMRLLIDEHGLEWQHAWQITTSTLNYTNHTLLSEALETWPVALLNRLLPRHMQLIYLINWYHIQGIAAKDETAPLVDLSILEEGHSQRVRMGHLAFIGSHRVNGVSKLHTALMAQSTFHALNTYLPGRIVNETNGISFRRWLQQANPSLTDTLIGIIGPEFLDMPDALRDLEKYSSDAVAISEVKAARKYNKERLAAKIRALTGIAVDPSAMFDVHIKRIHEYKRQLLNILEAIGIYHSIVAHSHYDGPPRVKIFAGKAASNYGQAKLIIKLINDVAAKVNHDPVVAGRLKIVFLPNYNVSLAEVIIPATDLSEQISTAGTEASGTGNMKLALNGALTVGTLDGANIEIREHVGAENFIHFGLEADAVKAHRHSGYVGRDAADASPLLTHVISLITQGVFSPDDPMRFRPLVDRILGHDEYMTAADFDAYWAAQRIIDKKWLDQPDWWRSSVLNTARMGWFSSDRLIQEYATDIWRLPKPLH